MTNLNLHLPSLPESSQRFIGRIFGPLAEVGDFLSEKIRFYRWKSALEMLRQAEEIAKAKGIEPKEIPLKKLVPLLEKSSLEPEDSPILEMWANLLANAMLDEDRISSSYIDILSRLDHHDVQNLDRFIPEHYLEDIRVEDEKDGDSDGFLWAISIDISSDKERLLVHLTDILNALETNPVSMTDNFTKIQKVLYDHVDVSFGLIEYEVIDLRSEVIDDGTGYNGIFATNPMVFNEMRSFDGLISCGLLSRWSDVVNFGCGRASFTIIMPTLLGVDFIMACRGDTLEKRGLVE